MADLTVAEVLDRAADLIEPEGKWVQGRYGAWDASFGGYCAFCLYGAVHEIGGHTDVTRAADGLLDALTLGGIGSAIDWNDAPDRTQTEVVANLREAAAKAREAVHA